MIVASDAAYPEPLRAIADYPGALFVKGDIAVLKSQQLAVVGTARIHGMASVGGASFVNRLRVRA